MMEQKSNDLNISGYKIINLANPTHEQDAATKEYVDEKDEETKALLWEVHDYTPLSNRSEYIWVINTKHVTMASLAGICTVTTNFKCLHGEHAFDSKLEHIWLESVSCPNRLYFIGQDLKGKYIQVQYKFPVIVKAWQFLVRYVNYKWIPITYHWQVSNDGEHWVSTQKVQTAICSIQHYNGNTHNINFTNHYVPNDGYSYWRVWVVDGSISKEKEHQPWVNMLFMKLE